MGLALIYRFPKGAQVPTALPGLLHEKIIYTKSPNLIDQHILKNRV